MSDRRQRKPAQPGQEETPPDPYEIFLRVIGWVYLGIGVAMLAFFLLWLRG